MSDPLPDEVMAVIDECIFLPGYLFCREGVEWQIVKSSNIQGYVLVVQANAEDPKPVYHLRAPRASEAAAP